MTLDISHSTFFVEGLHKHQLSARQQCLLTLTQDFILDPSRARTLNQALHGHDPLDLVRMLAQQWNLGLSTLSGDFDHEHDIYIQPGVAAIFIDGVRAALQGDPHLLNLPSEPKVIYGELLRQMAKNQPHHAAWCAALLWQRPMSLN